MSILKDSKSPRMMPASGLPMNPILDMCGSSATMSTIFPEPVAPHRAALAFSKITIMDKPAQTLSETWLTISVLAVAMWCRGSITQRRAGKSKITSLIQNGNIHLGTVAVNN